jgi:hypothetical protein
MRHLSLNGNLRRGDRLSRDIAQLNRNRRRTNAGWLRADIVIQQDGRRPIDCFRAAGTSNTKQARERTEYDFPPACAAAPS